MTDTLADRAQRYLMASAEEMQKAGLPQYMQARLFRLREMYAYWLQNPRMVDKDIVTVKISNKKGFESRFRDFEKMGDAGLIGFRFESHGGNLITLLYFKPS